MTLKSGPASAAEANRQLAGSFAAAQGISPRFVYGEVFSGFAARVPAATAEALRRHPAVAAVDADRKVRAFESLPCQLLGCGGSGTEVKPWGATLHAVKVLNAAGSGSNSGVIAGIDWVAGEAKRLGVPVVANMSLGGDGNKTGTCTASGFSGSDAFHRAICSAKNAGVLFAVAAGNDGADAATSTPAAYDDAVITVSATASGDDWPDWSNWGNDAGGWMGTSSAPVAIAAPGVDVLSLRKGGGTTTMSGTSMASPHVAGALALVLGRGGYAANGSAFTQARAELLEKAESSAGSSNTSGKPHAEAFLDVRGL